MINYELKNKDNAYADIDKAISINPNNPTPYGAKAIFKLGDLKFKEAYSCYRQFKKVDKKYKKTEKTSK